MPLAGATTSMPASRSGSMSPDTPSTITRLKPRLANITTALDAGVIISPSGTSSPASRSTRAKCAGVRLVPLVNTTYGSPRVRTHSSIEIAPGSGRSPWFTRSPSTSVPSMSKMNPRALRSRSSASSETSVDVRSRARPFSDSRNPGFCTVSSRAAGREPSSRSSRSTGTRSGL